MSPRTAVRPQPPGAGPRSRGRPWELAVGLAAALLAIGPLVRGPRFVPKLTVVNPFPYTLSLDVTSEHRDGWMGMANVPADSTHTVQDVVDHGRVWVFRVQTQGASGGEFRITRAALSRAGWRFTIPSEVELRLRTRGVTPDPGHAP
jgi:hypothetical protein